jgi:succinate dehydrogenase / fumarate reductase cytochrome b subunit
MALTGLVLVVYIIGHVSGNLLIFSGPEAINAYAEFLKSSQVLLWTVRVLVFGSLLLHVHAAYRLTLLNRGARHEAYRRSEARVATWSARSMRVGGVILLLFVVFHILHFTTGQLHPQFDPHDVYRNMVIGPPCRPSPALISWPWWRWDCTCTTGPGPGSRLSGGIIPR